MPRMNHYEIRVVGHLDARHARGLGCQGCRWLPGGDSILTVTTPDQAATYGLIARIRDAGLELVHVQRLDSPGAASDRTGE